MELKPGDELACGAAQLVVGVSAPLTAWGRRALTHHEFRERLYEELARAARGGRPTALLMLSARTGEGGRVTAKALESFRAGDVVATYASDELELLLPDTDGPTARAVVQRILAEAELEASVGLAVAPDHGDSPERLIRSARRALAAAGENGGFAEPPEREAVVSDPSDHMESRDEATRALLADLEDAAADDAPVLLLGEKSAGKSIFARYLHRRSSRREGPFVVLPCAALLDEEVALEVLTDELLEQALGGVLFLDEVVELDRAGQRRIVEWAEAAERDVRFVATTHRAIKALVERDAFDRALYELIAVHVVEVPALRNRPEDILPLARRFAVEAGASEPVRFSAAALARLRSYPWPGNVLELRNAMERAVCLARDSEILAEHLPSEPMPIASSEGRLREHVDNVERDAIIKALADCNHNQTHAAKRLGISRRALIYKMEKYGLKRPPRGSRRS